MLSQGKNDRLKNLLNVQIPTEFFGLALILLFFSVFCWYAAERFYFSTYEIPFDSVLWKNEPSLPTSDNKNSNRARMVNDLFKKHVLVGMGGMEMESLLGSQHLTQTNNAHETFFRYNLGWTGLVRAGPLLLGDPRFGSLYLYFGKDGKVSRYDINWRPLRSFIRNGGY
jgi:hypothetical protein